MGADSSPKIATKKVDVKHGDTLSKIIQNAYGISYGSGKKYDSIEKSILQLNRLKTPEQLKVGPLVLPFQPPAFSGSTISTGTRKQIVTIKIKLDAIYTGSENKNDLLRRLSRIIPPATTSVAEGDTLSHIIAREYLIGSAHPAPSYILEKEILQYNDLQNPKNLQVGECLLPALPKRQKSQQSSYVQIPFVKYYNLQDVATESTTRMAYRSMEIETNGGPSLTTILQVEIPDTTMLQIAQDSLLSGISFQINGKIPIKLADPKESMLPATIPVSLTGGSTSFQSNQTTVLIKPEAEYISRILQQFSVRKSFVFIQDTGWPSSETQQASYRHLFAIMDFIWTNKLGLQQISSPYPRTIPTFTAPGNNHCEEIKEALQEFEQLDHGNQVQVIFLPLNLEQNSKDLITELVHLYLLISRTSALQSLSNVKDQLRATRKQADQIVNRLPRRWESNQIDTDIAVVSAPIQIMNWYGNHTGTFSFFNQSWTTPHRLLKADFPVPFSGVIVAAAGNESTNYNILEKQPDFVQRCQGYSDTIGVLNVHRGKMIDASSSDLRGIVADEAFVAGFEGTVNPHVFGTSFSAPRVAWLLAASESLRRENCLPSEWSVILKRNVKNSRNSATAPDKFWLNPVSLMQNTTRDKHKQ